MTVGDPLYWLVLVILGALTGALGQGARALIGLKKLKEENAQRSDGEKEAFTWARLGVSLAIGAAAGFLAMLTTAGIGTGVKIEPALLLGWFAAGYSGADFIEGLMSKSLPQKTKVAAAT
jgi:hypothetical protein